MHATPLEVGRSSADMAGMAASIACAIHCAAMPLVIGYLPMLGLSWLANESFHQVMAAVCFALAVSAFLPGWRKHRSALPACIGAAGVTLLTFAAFGLEGECCPSCAAAGEAAAPDSECTDEFCPHCVAEEPEPPAADPSGGLLASWAVPFVTPFGGLLLVTGHVANHRKSCLCRDCCTPPEKTGEA